MKVERYRSWIVPCVPDAITTSPTRLIAAICVPMRRAVSVEKSGSRLIPGTFQDGRRLPVCLEQRCDSRNSCDD
jgi:hypothetical protein